MKMVLVIVKYPYGANRAREQENCNRLYQAAREKSKTSPGIEQLDDNVWLIDAILGLNFLAWLLSSLESIGVERRVAFLSEPPQWTS